MAKVLRLEKATDLPLPRGGDDEARKFYGHILGLREVMRTPGERGVWFDIDGTALRLRQTLPMPEVGEEIKAHFHVDDVESLRRAVQSSRYRAWDAPALTGTLGVIVQDPVGHRMELREYRTAAARERVRESFAED